MEESGVVKDKIMNDLERFVDEQQIAITRTRAKDTIHAIMMNYMVHKDQENLEAVLFLPGLFNKKARVMRDLFDWRTPLQGTNGDQKDFMSNRFWSQTT